MHTYDQLTMMITAHVPPLMAADECTLFTYEFDELMDRHNLCTVPPEGVVGQVVQTGQTVRLCAQHNAAQMRDIQGSAILCVPIVTGDGEKKTVGVLRILRTTRDAPPFADEDQNMAELLCCYLACTLQFLTVSHQKEVEVQKTDLYMKAAQVRGRGRASLEGEGGDWGNSRAVVERAQGM